MRACSYSDNIKPNETLHRASLGVWLTIRRYLQANGRLAWERRWALALGAFQNGRQVPACVHVVGHYLILRKNKKTVCVTARRFHQLGGVFLLSVFTSGITL